MSEDPNDRAARLAGRWGGDVEESTDEVDAVREEAVDEAVDEADGGSEEGGGGSGEAEENPQTADGNSRTGADDSGKSGSTTDEPTDETEDRELTTREMQSQMLYLPPEFHREVDLTFEELNLRFRRERDRKLEKNKDFYTGLLRLGLDRLGDVRDAELDELEELLEL